MDRLDPRDQAHLDAAARDPAYAAALRRHFLDQQASTRALLVGYGRAGDGQHGGQAPGTDSATAATRRGGRSSRSGEEPPPNGRNLRLV
jgi:hypothetical protein